MATTNMVAAEAMVVFLCKCMDVEAACEVFDEMVERHPVSGNALISGYLRRSKTDAGVASGLFGEMPQREICEHDGFPV